MCDRSAEVGLEWVGIRVLKRSRIAIAAIAVLTGLAGPVLADEAPVGQTILRAGSTPTIKGPAAYFTGDVLITPLFPDRDTGQFGAGAVSFAPGARTAWHRHPAGQHLLVTSGVGWTQVEGGPVVELRAGDVIWCPPGVKHWHGARPDSAMSHIAVTGLKEGRNVEWLEKVSDDQYRR